ncbi:hypothetical protein SCLCIDRAFT_311040 [Scleroderma citrinum Foug A]|uniref:Uncharacterized protein n=1 Tax=Scleroderma citrinum Foug A TaxID=1036808 RepID=A0A0C2Z043_9AGAM|nr:hypothetical protein SCLCIDRAFT_311040 [Scleroderma citrinum Foug A]
MVPAIKSSTIFADTSSPAERAGSFKTTCKDHMSGVFGKGMRESGENKMWAEQTMSEVSARLHAVALQWKFSLSLSYSSTTCPSGVVTRIGILIRTLRSPLPRTQANVTMVNLSQDSGTFILAFTFQTCPYGTVSRVPRLTELVSLQGLRVP